MSDAPILNTLVQLFGGIYNVREPTARTTVDDIVTDILGKAELAGHFDGKVYVIP